jgi:hypothetical protein
MIRNNPLVAKVVNGKRVPVIKSAQVDPGEAPALSPQLSRKVATLSDFIKPKKTSAAAAPAAAAGDDLTELLQQSLAKVKKLRDLQ